MRYRALAAATALLVAVACAHAPSPSGPAEAQSRAGPPQASRPEIGLASFYGRSLQGRRTASGARYDMQAFTCAHPSAPFGTVLRVTALESGRSVEVEVTDRGPFGRGRVVDLSWAAAQRLGIVASGVARVRVEWVRGPAE